MVSSQIDVDDFSSILMEVAIEFKKKNDLI